jgi:hypothetical protein
MAWNSSAYGPDVEALLALPAPDGLEHGPAVIAAEPLIAALTLPPTCLAGLWLRFDFAERGHALAQTLPGPDGDYWHAIHHRREPDPGNAKYWCRRVGSHPVHAPLLVAARALGNGSAAARQVAGWTAWDAFGFVDLCAAHAGDGSADEAFCKAVQEQEWRLLFDRCFRAVTTTD